MEAADCSKMLVPTNQTIFTYILEDFNLPGIWIFNSRVTHCIPMLDWDGEELTSEDSGPSPMAKDSFSPPSFLQRVCNVTSSTSITMVLLHEGQVIPSSSTPESTSILIKNKMWKMCNGKGRQCSLQLWSYRCQWINITLTTFPTPTNFLILPAAYL